MWRDWLYYLITESGACYTVVNGVVQQVAVPTPQKETPDGWQEISIGWERTISKLGVVRNFSLPLSFYLDGARILRHVFYTGNVEEKVYLLIQKLELAVDQDYYYPVHKYFYKGELDFSTFKDEEDRVTINIVEGGILQKLKAKESLAFEFPIDEDPEAVVVKTDGFVLKQVVNFINPGVEGVIYNEHFLPISFVSVEGTSGTDVVHSSSMMEELPAQPGPHDLSGSNNWFFYTIKARTVRIVGSIKVDFLNEDRLYGFRIQGSSNTVYHELVFGAVLYVGKNEFAFDIVVNLPAEEKLFITAESISGDPFNYEDSKIRIDYDYRFDATFTKGLKLSTLFRRAVGKATGNEADADTSFLSLHDDLVITCGDAIRRLAGAKIKTTLAQYLEFCRVVLGADHGVAGGKILVQEYGYFLKTDNPVHLGKAKDLKVFLASELLANSFKIGYQEQSYDDVNGRYEFNNTHVYGTPVTKIVRELNLVSPYRADPYGIELTRINLEGKLTTDNTADNDTFVLKTVPFQFSGQITASINGGDNFLNFSGAKQHADWFSPGDKLVISGGSSNNGTYTVVALVQNPIGNDLLMIVAEAVVPGVITGATTAAPGKYQLKRVAYDTITGVPDPVNIFNIEGLTPKRLAMVHARWIQSILYGFTGQSLTFQTTEKNSELWTIINNPPASIKENADLNIGSDILFKPYWFELETEVPVDLASILDENPNRPFTFEWDGIIWKGFLFKGGIAPDSNKEQVYKLLAAPENDMTKLIK